MKQFLFLLLAAFSCFATPKTHYSFSSDAIDVVIPCHPKDEKTLDKCIEGIRKNGKHIRNIFVISERKMTDKAIWITESFFPFQKQDLIQEISRFSKEKVFSFRRVGWMYQQLMKLYAPFVIPEISPNVLVLDADTLFFSSVSFMTEEGEPLFAWGKEYYPPYFKHANRLLSDFTKVFPEKSGICHHMLFQKPVLIDLMKQLEKEHGCEAWQAFCRCIDLSMIEGSCFSEYEIYFNFIFQKTDQAHLRELKWKNSESLKKRRKHKRRDFKFVSYHNYPESC